MSQQLELKHEKKQFENASKSFAQQLFFGRLDDKVLLPFPRPTLEEKEKIDLLCHKLRQFSETHINPVEIDRNAKIPVEVIQGLAKLGLMGLNVPQQYGGLGMSLTAFCKALEVISQQCGSTAAFLTAHQSIGYKALLLYGSPEQKQKWLPEIAKGEIIAAFALTEPNAGSDANAVETKAVYDSEKNIFYLTGKKQWITNGNIAKFFTVIARTDIDSQHRLTAFIVTPDMPGFKVTDIGKDKVGMRGIQNSSLEFDHIEIPVENMLGRLGEGLKIALSVLNYGRITIGASCAGPAQVLVDHAYKYARERHQFHQPLSSFALVKNKLAFLAAMAYAIDAVTFFTAGKVDAGEKDFKLEAAMVKVFSTEGLWSMIFETMQIFGGKSMFTDQPYELMMRNCRPGMIVEGSNDVMRMFISVTALKEVANDFNDFLLSLKSPFLTGASLRKGFSHMRDVLWPANADSYSQLVRKEAKRLKKTTRQLGRCVIQFLFRYGDRTTDKQIDLERFAAAVIYLYATAAVISKLDTDLDRVHGKVELLGKDIETAKFFCRFALKKASLQLQEMFCVQDKEAEKLSDLLIEDL